MVMGRPRNLKREVEILTLLNQGMKPGQVAKRVGVNRNTIYKLLSRIRDNAEDARELLRDQEECRRAIERLNELQAYVDLEKRRLAEEEKRVARRAAMRRLTAFFEMAADSVEKGRAIWLSLDKPLTDDLTGHHLVPDRNRTPEQEAEANEMRDVLDSAMEQLSEIQKRVLRFVFWENKSAEEIASDLQVSVEVVNDAQSSGIACLQEHVA